MEGVRLADENGKPIVPIVRNDPYSWVKGEVREMGSLFTDMESIEELGDPSLWVREGSNVKVEFIPCSVEDRMFHKGDGWEYFYVYTTLLLDLGVRFPFSEFECGVLSQLKCAPSQIHPHAWAFIRGFEVLMEFLGCEPQLEVFFSFFQAKGVRKGGLITLNSCQGRMLFELYKSSYKDFKQMFVKILGMKKVDDESALVIDVLEQYLCVKEQLLLNKLLRWEKERESVTEYIETTTGGLKNFFKLKNERELSTSNAVKAEKGVVVNQLSEKRRPISVKRRCAEEGTSERGKVIDLTNLKCCGKEVSLEEVKMFTANQKKLHGYAGAEDLSSVWSEHFPIPVVAEEHFQSKADFDLIESVSDVGRARFMQVYSARMLCIGCYEELRAKREAEQKKNESVELERSLEKERKLQLAMEQMAQKDKELLELKGENAVLKGKVQGLEKDKLDLKSRVVELCGQKKETEVNKENYGYDMLLFGFERAKKQAEFLFPEVKFDKLDPIKVVHNRALVDDDEVDCEGGGD
ncbi:hypothetical protein PIB30_101711 [Stylosanthes scabra]|uniref:Transposase (putative) gypsy type domain-containing protein n=1 Tax=Stylosanthes scabra TaxID=79078 RepID=A0ABU6XYE3_9FABA|nr:hypothetical protein [Stylosanthes scabra]